MQSHCCAAKDSNARRGARFGDACGCPRHVSGGISLVRRPLDCRQRRSPGPGNRVIRPGGLLLGLLRRTFRSNARHGVDGITARELLRAKAERHPEGCAGTGTDSQQRHTGAWIRMVFCGRGKTHLARPHVSNVLDLRRSPELSATIPRANRSSKEPCAAFAGIAPRRPSLIPTRFRPEVRIPFQSPERK